MKKTAFYLILLLSLGYVTGCTPLVQHTDTFYNVPDDFSMNRIPLIKPIEMNRLNSSSPWDIELHPAIWIDFPNSQGIHYPYGHVHGPEKFAVSNGVIMAYSAYIDKEAAAYIQDNYFYWFILVPDKEVTEGFHTDDEFRKYIQTLGLEAPDWQTPDQAFNTFVDTGCLAWIPDCK